MGIFGGEKYSKEGYEKAKEQADKDLKVYNDMGLGFAQRLYDKFEDAKIKSKKRLEKIYGNGQAEAIALNKEYDRLFAEAQESIRAVADFEREKLGMHKEGAEEADADKK